MQVPSGPGVPVGAALQLEEPTVDATRVAGPATMLVPRPGPGHLSPLCDHESCKASFQVGRASPHEGVKVGGIKVTSGGRHS